VVGKDDTEIGRHGDTETGGWDAHQRAASSRQRTASPHYARATCCDRKYGRPYGRAEGTPRQRRYL
jgi:hypothetical protein